MWRGVGFIIVIPTNELTKGERERDSQYVSMGRLTF